MTLTDRPFRSRGMKCQLNRSGESNAKLAFSSAVPNPSDESTRPAAVAHLAAGGVVLIAPGKQGKADQGALSAIARLKLIPRMIPGLLDSFPGPKTSHDHTSCLNSSGSASVTRAFFPGR